MALQILQLHLLLAKRAKDNGRLKIKHIGLSPQHTYAFDSIVYDAHFLY